MTTTTFEGKKIDWDTYAVGKVLLILNNLVRMGLVNGGYEIDAVRMARMVEFCEAQGFREPTEEEIKSIVFHLQHQLEQ